MMAFVDWFPLLTVGGTFIALGLLKVHGFRHNIVGGGGKPWSTRLLGACPTWSKQANIIVTMLFLIIGALLLGKLGWLILSAQK